MLKKINLQQKLEKFRDTQITGEEILAQVQFFLSAEKKREDDILERLENGSPSESNQFDPDLLEARRVFHISHIRNICVDYRLRFLNTKFFKGALPPEALIEIKNLEREHQTSFEGFTIMAPSKNFRLENADDPILFAPIGNGYYYLIHKWGTDLHPLRKILMWPFKNIENLAVFTILFSFLFTFVVREIFFSRYQSTTEFIMLFMFTFKSMVGLVIFYGIAIGKNFSSGIWNSKYYNA